MQKKRKQFLSILLSVCMLLTFLPGTAFAEENVLESSDKYTDVKLEDAKAYLTGKGTENDPFQIWTADDLYYINYIEYWRDSSDSEEVFYYQQKADLDLSDASRFDKPYGYITANFGGVYDGGDHSISGMEKPLFYFTKGTYTGDENGTVFSAYRDHSAVFSAIVRNLTVSEPTIEQAVATDVVEQMGAVAAYAINTTFYNIKVSGGYVRGVSGAAAIVGRAGSVVIDRCESDSEIYASMHRASGIVSNLRVVDEKKGAETTSLVTNCTFSGTISGMLDGNRGSAGIVGGVYAEGTPKWPLYLTDCIFSGAIDVTVTSGTGNVGGILGVSFLSDGLHITGNTSSGTITAKTSGSASIANVGGVIGMVETHTKTGNENQVSGNSVTATLPASDHDSRIYAGQLAGCVNSQAWKISGEVSVSEDKDSNGLYGIVQQATLSGEVGELVIPASSNAAVLYIEKGCTISSITSACTNTLTIYNDGTVGDVKSEGTVTVAANSGTIGAITSGNAINVGASNKTEADNGGYIGNAGTLGKLTAQNTLTIYRNTDTIDAVESGNSSVTIGQNSDYNTNAGAIGSVKAATTVSIYGTSSTGSVAAGEEDSIEAAGNVTVYVNRGTIGDITSTGGTVAVGSSNKTAENNGGLAGNEGTMGNLTAKSSVTIYRNAAGASIGTLESKTSSVAIGQSGDYAAYNTNAGTIGNVAAATTVAIYGIGDQGSVAADEGGTIKAGTTVTIGATTALNQNEIGPVEAGTSVTIYGGESGKVASAKAGTSVAVGSAAAPNQSEVGTVNAGTTVGIYNSAEGSVGDVTASGNVTIGSISNSTATLNLGNIGDISTTGEVKIYSDTGVTIGDITRTGETAATVTIGSATVPNKANVGDISNANGTVTGYTTGTVGTVTAKTNTLLIATDTSGEGELPNVITTSGSITISADEDGKIKVGDTQYAKGSKLVLTADSTVTFNGDYEVNLSAIQASGKLIILDADGKAKVGSITGTSTVTLGNNTALFKGTVGDVTANSTVTVGANSANYYFQGSVTGNITGTAVTIYNVGTIGIDGENSTVTATTGNISITNNSDGKIYSNIVNNSTTGMTSVTNKGNAMSGNITSNSTGALTLSGNYDGTNVTDKKFTGNISANGNLVIGGSLGPNEENSAVTVTLTDGATITANGTTYVFYLKVTGDDIKNIIVTTTATQVSENYRNTIDLSKLSADQLSVSADVGPGTLLKTPDTSSDTTSLGTAITVSSNKVTNAEQVASTNAYYTGGTLIVGGTDNTGVKISEGSTLTLTNSGTTTIYNYGTIGDIRHTGSGTLIIYNLGQNAKIGNVTSNASVTVQVNDGEIGNVSAASAITVGANNKNAAETIKINNVSTTETYNIGNNGKLGDLTAAGGALAICRNTGTIGAVESKTSSVIIGQNSATYWSYNTNTGTIGSVKAETTVGIYGSGENGKVAAEEDESIQAGTTVAVGAAAAPSQSEIGTVQAGTTVTIYGGESGEVASVEAGTNVVIGSSTVSNQSKFGAINAVTGITIYNGAAEIGNVTNSTSGNLLVYSNAKNGKIGNIVNNGGSVTVGADSKTASDNGNGAYIGNEGTLGSITASSSVSIKRNTGTIGAVKSTTASIAIGQNSANYMEYNTNSGTIGSVDAATTVAIYATSDKGSVAADTNEKVKAGTTVTIGSTIVANKNEIGPVEAGTGVTIYNGAAEIGDVTNTSGTVTVCANASGGTIGDITNNGGVINVGANNKNASTSNGSSGNEGKLGNLTAASTVAIYRNTEGAEIGNVKSETSSVMVGNYSTYADITAYNANFGTIGSIEAATTVSLYNNASSGKIATGEGQNVTAKSNVTVGYYGASSNLYMKNEGQIGTITTESGSVSVSNNKTIGTITNKGTGNTNLYIYDGADSTSLIAAGGSVTVNDKTENGTPNVNVTTSGGSVTVNPNTEDDTNIKVHVTVTDKLGGDETLAIRGKFVTVLHNGAGKVLMETADTSVTNVAETSTGKVLLFGETGTVVETPKDGNYTLSLVQTGPNTVDVYLLSLDGTVLDSSNQVTDLKVTVGNGTISPTTATVTGGGASEKIATVTLTESGTLTVAGTYQEKNITATLSAEIPALVDRVDTVLLTSEADFDAAKATYGWDNAVTAPSAYPVLAVMPVINEAYADDSVTVKVNDNKVSNGVIFVSEDVSGKQAGDNLGVSVSASISDGSSYSGTTTYTLTAADLAKLDDETQYWYVTLRYMDGTTADKVVPVAKDESLTLETPSGRTGYSFLGWSDGTTVYTAGTTYTPNEDAMLTAQWGANAVTHTLTINISGSGTVVRVENGVEYPITSGTKFAEGTVLTLKANHYSGSYFQGWTVDGTAYSTDTVTITMDADTTVTASFGSYSSGTSAKAYSVSVGSASNGTVSVDPRSAAKGTAVTITAIPDAGYQLALLVVTDANGKELTLTDKGNGQYTFTMPAGKVSVVASFVKADKGLPFTDVASGAYYYDAVAWAVAEGITQGTTPTQFSPDSSCTRAQAVTFLWRAAGSPAPQTAENPFADVSSSAYYYEAVLWAVEQGITVGTSTTTFSPDSACIRGQIVTFLYRAAGATVSGSTPFTDVADSDYYADAVKWAVDEGITFGTSATTFSPDQVCTRAQIVTFLYRANA